MQETTRFCAQCDVTRPLEEFDGLKTCRRCRKYRNAWMAARSPEKMAYVNQQASARRRLRRLDNLEVVNRERENSRRRNRERGVTNLSRGDVVTMDCSRCGTEFSYTFAGARRRTMCPLCFKHRQAWDYYGLTGPEAAALREKRVCDICGSTNSGTASGLFRIDHCHQTGTVRGMLCHACNITLGMMKDSPELLRAAAQYLEQSLLRSAPDAF